MSIPCGRGPIIACDAHFMAATRLRPSTNFVEPNGKYTPTVTLLNWTINLIILLCLINKCVCVRHIRAGIRWQKRPGQTKERLRLEGEWVIDYRISSKVFNEFCSVYQFQDQEHRRVRTKHEIVSFGSSEPAMPRRIAGRKRETEINSGQSGPRDECTVWRFSMVLLSDESKSSDLVQVAHALLRMINRRTILRVIQQKAVV